MLFSIQRISIDHSLYPAELDLRFAVLRVPLGLGRETLGTEHDHSSLHWVALDGDAVVGCVLLLPSDTSRARLRAMAVDSPWRGRGVGRALVAALERDALELGYREIFMHARENAIGFYQRLGYQLSGDRFSEVGIPHRIMSKSLS
jgi:N-acetylglutamate synthase-like GNAT family acetyltransferase